MLFQKYEQKSIDYRNGYVETMKVYDDFYYDKETLLHCPDCNNILFYVENYTEHDCPNKGTRYIINKFVCKIDNIQNKCVIHQKEFQYYKDRNYYCSLCLKENKIKEYLNLDEIILSKEEIENFQQLILKSENVMEKIKEKSEKFIKKLKENYDTFIKRNENLIDYCKGLLRFNEMYEKNFNLIATIRRISLDLNIDDFKNYFDKMIFMKKKT